LTVRQGVCSLNKWNVFGRETASISVNGLIVLASRGNVLHEPQKGRTQQHLNVNFNLHEGSFNWSGGMDSLARYSSFFLFFFLIRCLPHYAILSGHLSLSLSDDVYAVNKKEGKACSLFFVLFFPEAPCPKIH